MAKDENSKTITAKCLWKILITCAGIILTIAGVIYGYGVLNSEVKDTREDLQEHCKESAARDVRTETRVRAVEDSTLRMEGDVSRIQADIREQKVLLKEIHDKVK